MYKTIVVADLVDLPDLELEVVSFDQYVTNYPKLNEPRTRIINLCDTAQYLSRGYYCSLLAESRQHKVLPSVNTINDMRILDEGENPDQLVLPKLNEALKGPVEFLVYFGGSIDPQWAAVAKSLFERYRSPALRVRLNPLGVGVSLELKSLSPADLSEEERVTFYERLRLFTEREWRNPVRKKSRWDMAILYDSEEANSPSDEAAIKRFAKAAEKVGIHADVVRSCDLKHLSQYDALFIRETTRIDHLTYRLARKAEVEGLVVMDDPTSIMRCCNKIFLHDAFSYNGVNAPKTLIVSNPAEAEIDRIEANVNYPIVVKMPESSFSIGVYKVNNRQELTDKLKLLFESSALVLVQEYLFTEYDWRIGVLNGRAIYACKYFMARDHWQIYNHASRQQRYQSGGFETFPTFEVPRKVLKAALKASAIIGNGLYGVDIKLHENQAYVIEVNDNPSIDYPVEDQYVGDELYMMIMQEFVDRLERRGRR
jgi:glutathione synthase/RimK-type ligase-like ATP-grasp enzyme